MRRIHQTHLFQFFLLLEGIFKGRSEFGSPFLLLLEDSPRSLHPNWSHLAVELLYMTEQSLPGVLHGQIVVRIVLTDGEVIELVADSEGVAVVGPPNEVGIGFFLS